MIVYKVVHVWHGEQRSMLGFGKLMNIYGLGATKREEKCLMFAFGDMASARAYALATSAHCRILKCATERAHVFPAPAKVPDPMRYSVRGLIRFWGRYHKDPDTAGAGFTALVGVPLGTVLVKELTPIEIAWDNRS